MKPVLESWGSGDFRTLLQVNAMSSIGSSIRKLKYPVFGKNYRFVFLKKIKKISSAFLIMIP